MNLLSGGDPYIVHYWEFSLPPGLNTGTHTIKFGLHDLFFKRRSFYPATRVVFDPPRTIGKRKARSLLERDSVTDAVDMFEIRSSTLRALSARNMSAKFIIAQVLACVHTSLISFASRGKGTSA